MTSTRTPPTNFILQALRPKSSQRLLKLCKQVKLTYGDILCEPGDRIRYIYFINTGLVSMLTSVSGRESTTVEVGLVGREGVAGLSLLLGVHISPVRMLVQGTGFAMRMNAADFGNELKRNPALQHQLNQYLYLFMAQVGQTAACNSHHVLEKRLARWLLMTHDRMQCNDFYLTQEFLSHMLGVRRVGVSVAATHLQVKKLISYRRGNMTILNRKGLERASCRCYVDVNTIRDRMLADA